MTTTLPPPHSAHDHSPRGNILVLVLVLLAVGMTVVALSLALAISATQAMSGALEGDRLRAAVEGGVENAILRVLRDPAYGGETLTIDGVPVLVSVTQGTTTTMVATAHSGTHRQRYRVILERIDGILTVRSWQPID